MREQTAEQLRQWIGEIAGAAVELRPLAMRSYRATWVAGGLEHVFSFGRRLAYLEEPDFKARAISLMAEGQHSYFTRPAMRPTA